MKFLCLFLLCLLLTSLFFLLRYGRRWRLSREREKELERELSRQLEAARAEEGRKKDLVAFLAHDLKTPLTSVVGYLTILRDKPDLSPEERSRFTGIALDKAMRLEELLGEFFDISRMELAEDADCAEVQLSLLLEQVADEFYPIFREKALKVTVDVQPHLVTRGSGEKLARVFDNVLRNAVSYAFPGGEISLTAVREGELVHVRISDQGLTIPEGELSSIFQRFYRLDAARSSATGGAGLGLAISKEILEHHGGSISAESTGETTVFHIRLPSAASS